MKYIYKTYYGDWQFTHHKWLNGICWVNKIKIN